jgi:hypothetical protein
VRVKKYDDNKKDEHILNEDDMPYTKASSPEEAEKIRLKRDMHRSDMEKLKLFIQMLRRNAMYKKAKIYK